MPETSRKLLSPALLLTLLAVTFTFDSHGAHWLWAPQPIVAVIIALGAAIAWTCLLRGWHRQARSGAASRITPR